MKIINLSLAVILVFTLISSCSGDKMAQLNKLKQQQSAINDKIKTLQDKINSEKKDSLNSDEFKFVGVTDIKPSKFDHFIRVQGKLDGELNVGVFAEVPGTVSAKFADVGNRVGKGQVLAQIDDEQYRSQLEGLETQLKFATDMFDKQKRLWDQKIGSEVQFLQSKTTKESLELQIASLKQQIEKFKIKSPIAGVIEECNIKVGGVVSPDPRLAAYRVVEFKNLKVTAEVSEAYSARVQKGDRINVLFPDVNKQVNAEISFVSKYINPINRTFLVETRIVSEVPDLKANMIAILQINDYHSDNAILVPMNVIQSDHTGSYVYIAKSKEKFHTAVKQPVVIGNSYNGVAEILQGLGDGDKVISAGFQELIDGEYIRF